MQKREDALKSEEQKELQTEENNVDVAAAKTIEANEKKDAEREAEDQFKKKTIQKYTSMMPEQGQVLTKEKVGARAQAIDKIVTIQYNDDGGLKYS